MNNNLMAWGRICIKELRYRENWLHTLATRNRRRQRYWRNHLGRIKAQEIRAAKRVTPEGWEALRQCAEDARQYDQR